MSGHMVARLIGTFTSAALLLGMLVVPVAASGHTNRWVDDDATPGDGPSQCDTAAYSTIGSAIHFSAPGDWVYVCPGTYSETLIIPTGVHVAARPLHGATIAAPTDGTGNVVELYGDHATLRGFRINMTAVAAAPTIRTPSPGCTEYSAAVLALGNNDGIRDNLISAVGSGTLTGPCGYDYGIVVGMHGDSATARVTFNWVTDFKYGGILVEDTDSYAYVRRNTIRYFHESDCPVVAFTCTISLRPTVNPSVNSAFALAFGIGVESSARADIIKNWVGSGPDACSTGPSYSCPPTATPTLNDGISMTGLDGSETTVVRDNVVTRTTGGIVTRVAADGAVIHDNWVSTGHYGYQVDGNNDEWHDNHTLGNDIGVNVGGSGNNIHDNDFRSNGLDCRDVTSGSETAATANTWTNDLGNSDSPDGICIADAP